MRRSVPYEPTRRFAYRKKTWRRRIVRPSSFSEGTRVAVVERVNRVNRWRNRTLIGFGEVWSMAPGHGQRWVLMEDPSLADANKQGCRKVAVGNMVRRDKWDSTGRRN